MPILQRFRDKKFVRKLLDFTIGVIVLLLCGTLFLPPRPHQKLNFHNRIISTYDDRSENVFPGNSRVLSIDKDTTTLTIRYILQPGYTYPYAGVTIPFNDSTGKFFDCSRFDAIRITIASSQLSDCKLYLKLFDAKITKINDPLSQRYLKKDLVLNPVPLTVTIPFSTFITPEWWYQKNNVTFKDVAPLDFSKTIALQIESGSTAKTGVLDTLRISEISLIKRPGKFVVAVLMILLALAGGYAFFLSIPRKRNAPVVIMYDKKEMRNYRDIDAQRISTYLAENFSSPGLSIAVMGKALGYSRKKIAKVMKDEFSMGFKQYITSLRIHEAKRLLRETDRLVIEIALNVGFNNISHFNRVFKASTGLTPVEFRNKRPD